MRRLTNAERDDAARWFGFVASRARSFGRRFPQLAEDAEDAVSDVVMSLPLAAYRSPKLARLKFRSAMSHAIRAAQTYRRHRDAATRDWLAPDAHDDGPTPALDALDKLAPRQAEVIRLCVLNRMDLVAAAALMRTSKGNAYKALHAGLSRLRTLLAESA